MKPLKPQKPILNNKPISEDRLSKIEAARQKLKEKGEYKEVPTAYRRRSQYLKDYQPIGKKGNFVSKAKIKPKKKKFKKIIDTRPSKGEALIMDWLRKHGIRFIREKEFNDLINPVTGQRLRIDFYLLDHKMCIEFDGRQHFFASKKFDVNGDCLEMRQVRDKIKNNFCVGKNYKMLRIKYNQVNLIEKILCQHCLQSA